jgi:hypothetical protein
VEKNKVDIGSEELLTTSELAIRLKVKSSWIYSQSNELGVIRLGKYLRFSWNRVLQRLDKRSGKLGY